jgi:predicted nuclease with TOPRIM domain
MGNENTTPEKMKDIEMALKDISTVYSVGFWREKCRRLFADRQALMKENQRLQSELEEYTKANWEAQGREAKLAEALRWYADEANYDPTTIYDEHGPFIGSHADYDRGQRARDTLKELGLEE